MKEEKINLAKIAKEMEIDKPIMSYRMIGSRVELYLLGGEVLVWPGEEKPEKKHETKRESAKRGPKKNIGNQQK
jgi:hypothetical protein